MNESIEYRVGTATADEVYRHLWSCRTNFEPPLEQRVDISEYSEKLVGRSVTFEAWNGSDLIGLVAAYFNDDVNRIAFITSVSTMGRYKGTGIATELLRRCLEHARRLRFVQIGLNVDSGNELALGLYKKFNFQTVDVNQKAIIMKCDLE